MNNKQKYNKLVRLVAPSIIMSNQLFTKIIFKC